VAATAAVAAGTSALFQIFARGQATQFQRFADVLLDGVFHFVKFFLGINEAARHGIAHQRVAILLEAGNFFAAQGEGTLLLLPEFLAPVHQAVILVAGLGVTHESADALMDGLNFGQIENGLAKFSGFREQRRILSHDFIK
jgi:hypothetical protein